MKGARISPLSYRNILYHVSRRIVSIAQSTPAVKSPQVKMKLFRSFSREDFTKVDSVLTTMLLTIVNDLWQVVQDQGRLSHEAEGQSLPETAREGGAGLHRLHPLR